MRRFSFRPALTWRGRAFKGLRGWAGKPLHPPLTAIPIGAYVLAAVFDAVSFFGQDEDWARDFYRAATFVVISGAAVSVFTALTGFWDWLRSTEPGTQARRAASAHGATMVAVTVLVLTDIAVRLGFFHDDGHTPLLVLALSAVAAGLTAVGATIGGTLVYDYGFNVETAGDHPVWQHSEHDVGPRDAKS
jgi:uncharacterized membrane protein